MSLLRRVIASPCRRHVGLAWLREAKVGQKPQRAQFKWARGVRIGQAGEDCFWSCVWVRDRCSRRVYLLRIIQPAAGLAIAGLVAAGLGASCKTGTGRRGCVACDWTAVDGFDGVLTFSSGGGAGLFGGSCIRAPAATGSSSRGTSIAKLPR